MLKPVLDLRVINVGMPCEDYSLLAVAGPNSSNLPKAVCEKMQQHEKACEYHRSETWHQSAVSTPVTSELEKAALILVKKYSK
jgi:hypothetical protein